jgi:hypothetical protein
LTKHDEAPEPTPDPPQDVADETEETLNSEYVQGVRPLRALVVGKTVVASDAGHSGFTLLLGGGQWVTVYLDGERLAWVHGDGAPDSSIAQLTCNPTYGDGSQPLTYDYPYSNEHNDILAEIAKSTGKTITGLSYGSDCFNFCFPDGRELETMIVKTADGRTGLRVFWEQW